jgi:hypothetical protein
MMNSNETTPMERAALAALTGLLASPLLAEQITEAADDAAMDALAHNTALDAWRFAAALVATAEL